MKEFLFKRGFIISKKALDQYLDYLGGYIKGEWKRERIEEYFYYFDSDIERYICKKNKDFLLILGTCIDPINKIGDTNIIAERLLKNLLQGKKLFFNYLDYLTGRFVILVSCNGEDFLLHDATGINAVFYNDLNDEIIISSHTQIIAEIKGYKIKGIRESLVNNKKFKSRTCYMPGGETLYEEIKILTPNTLIDLNKKEIRRFFPREKLKKRRIDNNLIKETAQILTNTFDLLIKKYKLAISLTGGIDSRLTLASSRNYKDEIIYFTYNFDNDSGHLVDIELASRIAEIAGIRHEKYFIESNKYTDYIEIFNRNSGFLRPESQAKLAYAIYKNFPKGRIHIKSTVSEIAEGFYLRHFPPILEINFLLKYILAWFYQPLKEYYKFSFKAFFDFIKITKFKKFSKLGYNYYDMFYWEHRNGCWQSLQNQDFNIVHDIFIIYNNRELLKKFLSVRIKDRIDCRLHYELIRYLWPELTKIPFNSWKPVTLRQKITYLLWCIFNNLLP